MITKHFLKKIGSWHLYSVLLSVVIGTSIWYSLQRTLLVKRTYCVPVFFYNLPQGASLQSAPRSIRVVCKGPLKYMNRINPKTLCAHINLKHVGWSVDTTAIPLAISNKELFLPDAIKLVHYDPAPLFITLHTSRST